MARGRQDRTVRERTADAEPLRTQVEQPVEAETVWPRWEEISWHPELSGEGAILTGHRDSPRRNEERRLVRVRVESQNGTTICGQRVQNGESFLLVYASDVDRVIRMLPTSKQRQLLSVAEQQYDAALEAFIAECGGDVAKAEATRGFTKWTFYDALTRQMKGLSGGYPIVREVEVWDGVVPAPETPESIAGSATTKALEAQQKFADTIARALEGVAPR